MKKKEPKIPGPRSAICIKLREKPYTLINKKCRGGFFHGNKHNKRGFKCK